MTATGTVNDGNGGANYAVTFVSFNTGTISRASTTTVPANVTATYNVNDQTLTLTATVTAGVPIVNEGTVTFTVKDGTNTTVINVPVMSGTISSGVATASYNLLGGTSAGLYKINAHFNESTNFSASDGIANLTVTPGALLSDVSTSDSEFKNLDAFDVLFTKSKLGTAYAVLKNTKPGTFHFELTLTNETGTTIHKKGVKLPPKYVNNIAVNDTNGGSASVFLTVPALPADVKTTIPASANSLKDPAFILSGKKAIKVQKEDKSDMDGITIKWLVSIPAPYTECPQVPDPATGSAWSSSAPADGAAVKCIKIDGFEIPKHGKAKVDVSYDFRLKDTDGWLSTAQQKFLAGFAFKSTTRVTLDTDFGDGTALAYLAGTTYTGNRSTGLVGAGQQVTAVGGFVFDTNGDGVSGVGVKLYDTMPNPAPGSVVCDTPNPRASTTTAPDGFYFLYKQGAVQTDAAPINLPSGIRYAEAICDLTTVAPAYWPARLIDHKLSNKEFVQEDFYVSQPAGINVLAQPLSGRINKVLTPVQIAVRDAFGDIVTVDNSTTVSISGAPGTLTGTTSRTVVNGVANFNDLKFTATGNYVLTFSSPWGPATTLSINITT